MDVLNPGEIAERLAAWRAEQTDFDAAAVDCGLEAATLAPGLVVSGTLRPGELVVNGRLLYSAAWL